MTAKKGTNSTSNTRSTVTGILIALVIVLKLSLFIVRMNRPEPTIDVNAMDYGKQFQTYEERQFDEEMQRSSELVERAGRITESLKDQTSNSVKTE